MKGNKPLTAFDVLCGMHQSMKNIEAMLRIAIQGEKIIMSTIKEVLADVQDEKTVDDSLIVLTTAIKKQLDDLIAGGLTPEQQADVDAIFQQVEDNKAAVAAAILANTDALQKLKAAKEPPPAADGMSKQ
jgi:hypothetical protein